MDMIDILHQITESSMQGYGLSDLAIGTVTSEKPLEVKIRENMAPIPEAALLLTAAVIEKKIPVLKHEHITAGFRHDHALPDLSHSHSTEEGETGTAMDSPFHTESALDQDAFTSNRRLQDIKCYERGSPLPVEGGYIILNKKLETGDKVLLLRVMRGQQFIILSRVFEKEG